MRLSLGIPVFNEQDGLPGVAERLIPVRDALRAAARNDLRDGSTMARVLLEEASERDPRTALSSVAKLSATGGAGCARNSNGDASAEVPTSG